MSKEEIITITGELKSFQNKTYNNGFNNNAKIFSYIEIGDQFLNEVIAVNSVALHVDKNNNSVITLYLVKDGKHLLLKAVGYNGRVYIADTKAKEQLTTFKNYFYVAIGAIFGFILGMLLMQFMIVAVAIMVFILPAFKCLEWMFMSPTLLKLQKFQNSIQVMAENDGQQVLLV